MRLNRFGKRSLLAVALAVVASFAGTSAASAQETPPFDECPAIGDNTSCRILIEITAQGLRYYEDTSQPATYEGNATLIGVINHRAGQAVNSINVASPTESIFDFDDDGVCEATPTPPADPTFGSCPFGPTLYEGPGVSFSNISANERSGTVNFAGGLIFGASRYFGLEGPLTIRDLFALETRVSKSFTTVGGTGVTDTAFIEDPNTNDPFVPDGLITWRVYGPDDFNCSGDPVATLVQGVDGPGAYTSGTFFPPLAGAYSFVAEYTDDTHYSDQTSACEDPNEQVLAGPMLTTEALVSATVGQTIHDTATLFGARDPVGRITFSAFGPDDPDCSGPAAFIVDAPVQTGNGTYQSREFTTTQAGTYRWIARWEGDARNPAVETSCNDPNETTIVNPLPPIVVVPAHATSHAKFKVKYARFVKPRGKAAYLLVRVSSKRARHVRLRIKLSAKHWTGQSVTRKIRTNRAVKIRGLRLTGAQKVRVIVLGR